VYSDLPSQALKEDIEIYWENEDLEVTDEADLEYYDLDSNGLIERVSWVVPHLSTQYYRIVINVDVEGNESNEIILEVDSPPNNSYVGNPIKFQATIDYIYSSSVNCSLILEDNVSNESPLDLIGTVFKANNFEFDDILLREGRYDWEIYCWDTQDPTINQGIGGYFNVRDNFSISDLSEFYFNDVEISGTVEIPGGDVSAQLIRGGVSQEIVVGDGGDFVISNLADDPDDEAVPLTDLKLWIDPCVTNRAVLGRDLTPARPLAISGIFDRTTDSRYLLGTCNTVLEGSVDRRPWLSETNGPWGETLYWIDYKNVYGETRGNTLRLNTNPDYIGTQNTEVCHPATVIKNLKLIIADDIVL